MTAVFVDSGAWIALGWPGDGGHRAARAHHGRLLAAGSRLLTTNYVVDEVATWLRYRAGLDAALRYKSAVDRATAERALRVVWVDARLEAEGWSILRTYRDLRLSLTDATSAAAARRARAEEVFGFDGHFRALGFTVQPAPS